MIDASVKQWGHPRVGGYFLLWMHRRLAYPIHAGKRQWQNGQGMLAADSGLLAVALLAILAWESVR